MAYLLSWLTPNHYPPWVSFHGEALAFAALILFGWARAFDRQPFFPERAALLPLGLIAIIWLQWAAGLIVYSGDAAVSSLYLGGFAMAWYLGASAANNSGRGEQADAWLAGALIIAAAISVYIAAVQWQDLESGYYNMVVERAPWMRPYGNLAQPNHLATLILMGLVMTVWLFHRHNLRPWHAWLLALWFSFGLTMAQSRAAWLSALVLGILVLWRGRPEWRWSRPSVIFTWWSMLMLMGLMWRPINNLLMLQDTRPVTTIVQDQGRLLMWRQMLAGLEQSPWWGYGWRQTIAAHKAGTAHLTSGQLTDYAHSLPLDLLLWLGLPAAMFLMAWVGWWLLRSAIRIASPRQLLLLALAIPVMVHSLVEFPFAYAYFLFTVAWALGALGALQHDSPREASPGLKTAVRSAWWAASLLFTSLACWVLVEYTQVEEDYRVLRFEMRAVGHTPVGYERPQIRLLNQLDAVLRLGRVTPHPGMSEEELESMRLLNRNYNWATMQMRYAIALALNGRVEQAKSEMGELRAHFGEQSYRQAVALIRELQSERYPQLKELALP